MALVLLLRIFLTRRLLLEVANVITRFILSQAVLSSSSYQQFFALLTGTEAGDKTQKKPGKRVLNIHKFVFFVNEVFYREQVWPQ